MGEISFEAKNHYCFRDRDCLIKIAITFYYFVEFLKSANPSIVLNYNLESLTKNNGHWETTLG